MNWKYGLLFVLTLTTMAGCASMPAGPSVMVLPPPGKPFEVFAGEDALCRQWAYQQIGGKGPSETANRNLATGAAVGTAVGAGLGAAVGAATGNVGAGAAIGGATGLVGGTAMSSDAGYNTGYQLQRRYDISYQQCMYAKGNLLPGMTARQTVAPPPPDYRPSAPPAYGSAPPTQAVPKTAPPAQ